MKHHGGISGGLKPATEVHRTKTTMAIQALRSAILHGDIPQGEHLTVGEISRQLGMSPTPVREAIRTLQAEGLISHEPHHSVAVTRYTAKDIHDIFQLRATVESQATALATMRLTDEDIAALQTLADDMQEAALRSDYERLNRLNAAWHLRIYDVADNRILVDVIQHLWKKFMWEVNWIVPGHADHSIQQHAALMAALRSRDAAQAGRLMQAHIQSGEETATTYLRTRHRGED